MLESRVVICHPEGLHARPATEFVRLANKFVSNISVQYSGRKANAKSILKVLTLGAGENSEIVLQAEGEDEEKALLALKKLVESNFEVASI
jgi:phosphocarrier protein